MFGKYVYRIPFTNDGPMDPSTPLEGTSYPSHHTLDISSEGPDASTDVKPHFRC